MKDVLTTDELAQRWGINSDTIRRWRSESKGPVYTKINGTVRYLIDDIIKFERDSRVEADNASEESKSDKVRKN